MRSQGTVTFWDNSRLSLELSFTFKILQYHLDLYWILFFFTSLYMYILFFIFVFIITSFSYWILNGRFNEQSSLLILNMFLVFIVQKRKKKLWERNPKKLLSGCFILNPLLNPVQLYLLQGAFLDWSQLNFIFIQWAYVIEILVCVFVCACVHLFHVPS